MLCGFRIGTGILNLNFYSLQNCLACTGCRTCADIQEVPVSILSTLLLFLDLPREGILLNHGGNPSQPHLHEKSGK